MFFFFFKQKTAYEIYQCDWSSDVCSSDLIDRLGFHTRPGFLGLLLLFVFDVVLDGKLGGRNERAARGRTTRFDSGKGQVSRLLRRGVSCAHRAWLGEVLLHRVEVLSSPDLLASLTEPLGNPRLGHLDLGPTCNRLKRDIHA